MNEIPDLWEARRLAEVPDDWQIDHRDADGERVWFLARHVRASYDRRLVVLCRPQPKPPVTITLNRELAETFVGERAYSHEAFGLVRHAIKAALEDE